jgi:hypothetical protein
MEREGSMNGLVLDLEQLSLEKGRPLDVDDLDDEGWRAASEQDKIRELGSLGEGAGGAVTRCILDGGKTVFALKVVLSHPTCKSFTDEGDLTMVVDHHDRSQSRCEETDPPRAEFQQELRVAADLPVLRSLYGQVVKYHLHCHGIL